MADLYWKVKAYLEANNKTELEFNSNIVLQNDGSGDYIRTWNVDGLTKPTDSQLDALDSDATKSENNAVVRATRKTSYGDIGEQLDDLALSVLREAAEAGAERPVAEYFEEAAKGQDAKIVANWVTSDLFGYLNKEGLEISDSPVAGNQLGALVGLISNGTISGRIARDVFSEMCETGKDPAEIVEAKGLKQVSDTGELEELIDEVISNGSAQLEQYKSGNEKIIGWFVGQVMQVSKGQANPQMVNEILRRKLAE